MFDAIGNALKDKVKTLPYVGKIAGIVRTAVQSVNVETEDRQTVKVDERRFPVACSTEGLQCWNGGKYAELAPNQNYASVMYFEIGERTSISEFSRQAKKYTFNIRFVAWFNLAKIGYNGCAVPESITFELMDKLTVSNQSLTAYGITGGGLNTTVKNAFRDPSIFTKYSYDAALISNMLLYPFDYFAIDLEVALLIPNDCFTPYVPGAEITCIEL